MRRWIRAASAAIVVVVGAALTPGLATAQVRPHASTPTVVVTPSTGLTNGQAVSVSGSGFAPSTTMVITECLATATTSAGCDTSDLAPATTDASGNLPTTSFKVVAGTIGSGGTCGTSASDASNCVIVVSTLQGAVAGYAPITFATSSGGTTTTTTTTTTPPSTTSPTITVTPATGLKNQQNVSVTGSGFTPGNSVYVLECVATATGQSGCDIGGATAAVIDSSGNLPTTSFQVTTGSIGSGGSCGTTAANVGACVVVVANPTGGDRAVLPITFAAPAPRRTPRHAFVAPAANLHNGQVVRIHGQGFTPGDHLYMVECRRGATSVAQCDAATVRAVTVNAKGTFPVRPFVVRTGRIGGALCGTAPANLRACVIMVANMSGADRFVAPIAFRRP